MSTPPTLINFSVPLKVLGNAPFTLTAPTSNSAGAFSYASSKPSVATVAGNTVTIVGAGFTTITATQAAAGSFTSASITAGFSVLVESPLYNVFQPNTSNPTLPENSGVSVSGKFYDSKQDVSFDVNIFFQSSESYTMDVTNYKVTIDSLSQDSESVREDYTFVTESIPDSIGKRVVGNIIKSDISKLDTNKRGFSFVDLQIYAIKHSATIVQTNNDGDNTATPLRYVFNHTQIFRYYETPVKFSDFSFNDNAGLGDNLEVTGLYLDHGDNLPVDPTEPETVKFTFNIIDENNSDADLYFESEHTFSSNGTYTIQLPPSENPQGFELGNTYNITAQGQWTLGYDISETSSKSLNLLNRPEITNIEVLPLDVDSYAFDAGTWTNSNVPQLGGSGAPTLVGSSNTTNQTGSWSFSEATWVSTVINSNGTRTATYTGGTLTSTSFTGPVTITTTYGVDANDSPNTDIQFSIINPSNQAVIFSSVTLRSSLVPDSNSNKLTGKVAFDDDIMEITLAELSSSGSVDAPSKVWFEFYSAFDAGTWTNSNVPQLGGSGAPTLVGSSDTTNQTGSWSFSQATWVSPTVTNSNGTRTATYTGGILTSNNFNGPVTITTTYGVGANETPNTDILFSIINPSNQVVIFSSVTSVATTDDVANKITGTIPASDFRRYGLSRLQMPPTSVSGFVSGSPVNYMIILTTRRGTDIGVGEFTYQAVPSVSNVTISNINGQFFVDFVITAS